MAYFLHVLPDFTGDVDSCDEADKLSLDPENFLPTIKYFQQEYNQPVDHLSHHQQQQQYQLNLRLHHHHHHHHPNNTNNNSSNNISSRPPLPCPGPKFRNYQAGLKAKPSLGKAAHNTHETKL